MKCPTVSVDEIKAKTLVTRNKRETEGNGSGLIFVISVSVSPSDMKEMKSDIIFRIYAEVCSFRLFAVLFGVC